MKIVIIVALLGLAVAAFGAEQNFYQNSYFRTNTYLYDNTNTPLHNRIANSETGVVHLTGDTMAGALTNTASITWQKSATLTQNRIVLGDGQYPWMLWVFDDGGGAVTGRVKYGGASYIFEGGYLDGNASGLSNVVSAIARTITNDVSIATLVPRYLGDEAVCTLSNGYWRAFGTTTNNWKFFVYQ